MRKLFGSALIVFGSVFSPTGFSNFEKQSEVITQSVVKDKNVELEFKIKASDNHDLSMEGPWRLQLANTKGLKLEVKDGKFETRTMEKQLPDSASFKVKAELDGTATAGKVDFIMNAFVCDEKKTRCFPQTHKGTLEWKKS